MQQLTRVIKKAVYHTSQMFDRLIALERLKNIAVGVEINNQFGLRCNADLKRQTLVTVSRMYPFLNRTRISKFVFEGCVDVIKHHVIRILLQGVADWILTVSEHRDKFGPYFPNQRQERLALFENDPERKHVHKEAEGLFI